MAENKNQRMAEIGRKGGKVVSWKKIVANRLKAKRAADIRWGRVKK